MRSLNYGHAKTIKYSCFCNIRVHKTILCLIEIFFSVITSVSGSTEKILLVHKYLPFLSPSLHLLLLDSIFISQCSTFYCACWLGHSLIQWYEVYTKANLFYFLNCFLYI